MKQEHEVELKNHQENFARQKDMMQQDFENDMQLQKTIMSEELVNLGNAKDQEREAVRSELQKTIDELLAQIELEK
jgi:hypothetical protein